MQPKLHLHYKNHDAYNVIWVAYMLGSYSCVNTRPEFFRFVNLRPFSFATMIIVIITQVF
jgi:hypothetical protein